jgi:hypothetical protein
VRHFRLSPPALSKGNSLHRYAETQGDPRSALPLSLPSTDVRQLLSATTASLWATFQESAASARPDHKGHPREARLRQFLRERLPPKWGVSRGHVFYAEDATTPEFDVIVYDALNCPAWTLDSNEDPRRLVPLDAVIGVIEVKSTLDQLLPCQRRLQDPGV